MKQVYAQDTAHIAVCEYTPIFSYTFTAIF